MQNTDSTAAKQTKNMAKQRKNKESDPPSPQKTGKHAQKSTEIKNALFYLKTQYNALQNAPYSVKY